MNNERLYELKDHKTLQILSELSENGSITQRHLSSHLGIALGLVNNYLKSLVAKGYIRVKAIPPRRYAYFLTPQGFSEKARLTYHLLQDYTRIYRQARGSLKKLFSELQASGVRRIVFVGADEIAEIAYLTLQETDMELAGILDDEKAGKMFFGRTIASVSDITSMSHDSIVITSYNKKEMLYKALLKHTTDKKNIKVIFAL